MRPVIGPAQAVVKSSTRRPASGPCAGVAPPPAGFATAAARATAVASCSPSCGAPLRMSRGDRLKRNGGPRIGRGPDGRRHALPVVPLDQVRRAVPELHRRVGFCCGDPLLQQAFEQLVARHLAHALLHPGAQLRPVVLPLLALGEARVMLQLGNVRGLAEAAPHMQMHPDADETVGALHHHERRAAFAARVHHPAVGVFDRGRRRHRRGVHRHVERELLALPGRLARIQRRNAS